MGIPPLPFSYDTKAGPVPTMAGMLDTGTEEKCSIDPAL